MSRKSLMDKRAYVTCFFVVLAAAHMVYLLVSGEDE